MESQFVAAVDVNPDGRTTEIRETLSAEFLTAREAKEWIVSARKTFGRRITGAMVTRYDSDENGIVGYEDFLNSEIRDAH